MVLGIVGFLTFAVGIGLLLGLIAVICGVIAFSTMKNKKGKGMAIAGLILGAIELGIGLILGVFLSRFFL